MKNILRIAIKPALLMMALFLASQCNVNVQTSGSAKAESHSQGKAASTTRADTHAKAESHDQAQIGGEAKTHAGGEAKGSAEGAGQGMGLGDLKNQVQGATECPDFMTLEGIARVNFEKEFAMDARGAAKIRAALNAAAEVRGLSADIEAELRAACGKLARDLGERPNGDNAKAECQAAARGIAALKAKARGSFELDVVPPHCSASMDAMAECAGKCEAQVKPGKVDVKCEGGELSGRCDAKCEGKCELEAAASCQGTCHGSCQAQFSGSCSGKCQGKCDGKATKGAAECAGRCEGSCDAGAKGECGGSCEGECELKGQAECQGTCTGKCSIAMKAPHCTGEVKPPKASAECKAHCDAKVNARMECTPARVALKATGAANAAAAAKLAAALKADLPAVLKVALGMKGTLVRVAGDVRVAMDGAKAGIQASVHGAPLLATKLTACVVKPFKAAFDATGDLKASAEVSVDVSASASAGTR